MREITFTVPVKPEPQPRQRHRHVKTKDGREFTQNYTPADGPNAAFKATVRLAARQVYSGPPHDGPVTFGCRFVFPRPKGLVWKTKPMPRRKHTLKRFDFDNLSKSITDALTHLIWIDDGQIWTAKVIKQIAAGNEQPHCEVYIRLEDEE